MFSKGRARISFDPRGYLRVLGVSHLFRDTYIVRVELRNGLVREVRLIAADELDAYMRIQKAIEGANHD